MRPGLTQILPPAAPSPFEFETPALESSAIFSRSEYVTICDFFSKRIRDYIREKITDRTF